MPSNSAAVDHRGSNTHPKNVDSVVPKKYRAAGIPVCARGTVYAAAELLRLLVVDHPPANLRVQEAKTVSGRNNCSPTVMHFMKTCGMVAIREHGKRVARVVTCFHRAQPWRRTKEEPQGSQGRQSSFEMHNGV